MQRNLPSINRRPLKATITFVGKQLEWLVASGCATAMSIGINQSCNRIEDGKCGLFSHLISPLICWLRWMMRIGMRVADLSPIAGWRDKRPATSGFYTEPNNDLEASVTLTFDA